MLIFFVLRGAKMGQKWALIGRIRLFWSTSVEELLFQCLREFCSFDFFRTGQFQRRDSDLWGEGGQLATFFPSRPNFSGLGAGPPPLGSC